ncbi:MAG: hypothetical protein ACI4YB_01740 [Oscillospiraceae bacterium]
MAEPNYSEAAMFAATIAELDDKLPFSMSECYQFGMTWGCRPDCPAFIRGECDVKEENIEEWKKSGEYDYELEELGLL